MRLLILLERRTRDPNTVEALKGIGARSGWKVVIWDGPVRPHRSDALNHLIRKFKPHLIIEGAACWKMFMRLRPYPCKVARIVVDDWFFTNQYYTAMRKKYQVEDMDSAIISMGIPGSPNKQILRNFMDEERSLYRSSLRLVPWGVNPDKFKPFIFDWYDVSAIWTCSEKSPFHRRRVMVEDVLQDYKDRFRVYNQPVFGARYISVMNQTRISMVDTSRRGNWLQKHLESAASGCLLMGDYPYEIEDGFLKDGWNFVNVARNGEETWESELREALDYYLDPGMKEEVKIMAERLRARVIDRFHINNSTDRFIEVIKDIMADRRIID